jgi:tetratricopeptide (TPR) repeat protein
VNAVNIARCYYFARDYRRAMQSLEDLSKQEPNVWMIHAALGQTYIAMGDYEKAVGELNRARELSPSSLRNLAVLADAYGRAGRRGDALSIARQLAELARTRYVPPAYRALVNIGLGDHARALEYLQSARDERSEWITQLAMEPEFDPLREDPEFVQLLAH